MCACVCVCVCVCVYVCVSVLLDCRIYFTDEEVSGVKADGSREKPESKHHYASVTKVEESWDEVFNLQLRIGEREGQAGEGRGREGRGRGRQGRGEGKGGEGKGRGGEERRREGRGIYIHVCVHTHYTHMQVQTLTQGCVHTKDTTRMCTCTHARTYSTHTDTNTHTVQKLSQCTSFMV